MGYPKSKLESKNVLINKNVEGGREGDIHIEKQLLQLTKISSYVYISPKMLQHNAEQQSSVINGGVKVKSTGGKHCNIKLNIYTQGFNNSTIKGVLDDLSIPVYEVKNAVVPMGNIKTPAVVK